MSIDSSLFQSVCATAREATVLLTACETLEWDERTGMPVGAGEYRAEQVSALRSAVHRIQTDAAFGEKLQQLSEQVVDLDPSSDQAATVLGLQRDFIRNQKLPSDLVGRVAAARTRGQQIWDQAKAANDFGMFRDALIEMIELQRETGQRMAEGTDRGAYDALLDTYEPDARAADLQRVFDGLREPLVELIAEVRQAPLQPDQSILKRDFPIDAQRAFSHYVAQKVGFDFDRGRLDETSHPFCTTLGPSDCRILTRFDQNWLPCGLFGTLHEAGHGMYEQGLRTKDWFGLPPGSYASLGVHESQSRLWENQVGRSRSFWEWLYPEAQKRFPGALSDVSLDDFYFAVNGVQPSLIRVEADEATYNLHILIRFDLERQLIEGKLSVDDLPAAWTARYEFDLGIRPESDAKGVLQDVHWSAGLFGYFPTYTLGNLIGAQLFDAAHDEIGDLNDQFANGEFGSLLQWMQQNVHQPGKTVYSNQLVQQATGHELTHDHLMNYLRTKLSACYQLS